ncbi:DUF222 domain-containing protein [Kribbella qitaiheensis]|uniref:DUF222 domain-containing protein n=2 Tax=Kribbella qitaiheensis TaxID=1544730 RepID=A0A7G6X642_9ACTN|nr:DUF222 domain-containing protein [Kribbella qitaiheensis]
MESLFPLLGWVLRLSTALLWCHSLSPEGSIVASMFDSPAEMVDALTSVVGADAAVLDADELLGQLSMISQLESVLAARKAERMVGLHHVLAGTSADLGHESPRPGDRAAGPAERRWSGDVLRSVSDEIGLVLGAHRRTAARWLNRAAVLVERFPTTLALLRAGGLPAAAAQHIAHELAVIADGDLRAGVEKVVLAWGQRYGWARIKQIAHREAAKVLAEYESLLHAQRQLERTTYTVSHDGGMADLVVSTSAIDITAIMAALTARCIELQRQGDPRTLDQLRTDLAVARLLGHDQATAAPGAAAGEAPNHPGPSTAHPDHTNSAHPGSEPASGDAANDRGATAGRVADAETAPSTASAAAPGAPGAAGAAGTAPGAPGVAAGVAPGAPGVAGAVGVLPESGLNPAVGVQVVIHCTYAEAEALATGAVCTGGELEGYGTLPQDALAMAFTRAKFRYRLTDRSPKSDPARYTPSPGLDQHVRDRDRRCRFPGCNARVKYCDLDHRVPFPKGLTDADNLEAFCRQHHRLKHHGNWQIFTTDTGSLIWISPTDRAYIDPPAIPHAA